MSSLFGRFAYSKVSRPSIGFFARRYGVDLRECPKALAEFPSLGEFFIRDLVPGARPIGQGAVSPSDGKLTEHGPIEQLELTQIKGVRYSAERLFLDAELASVFRGGYFVTVYLAPPDYHHVHSPVDGVVQEVRLIEGTLWPVNEGSVRAIPGVFTKNERMVIVLDSGGKKTAVVCVGATNVGSIALAFDDLRTNRRPGLVPRQREALRKSYSHLVARGDRLATFRMGSTVVLLFEKGMFLPEIRQGVIRMGQSIGRLAT